jgi:hypothetical protein
MKHIWPHISTLLVNLLLIPPNPSRALTEGIHTTPPQFTPTYPAFTVSNPGQAPKYGTWQAANFIKGTHYGAWKNVSTGSRALSSESSGSEVYYVCGAGVSSLNGPYEISPAKEYNNAPDLQQVTPHATTTGTGGSTVTIRSRGALFRWTRPIPYDSMWVLMAWVTRTGIAL